MLPLLPGPFGELRTRMADKLDKCLVAAKGFGVPAQSTQLRWFYVDEMLDKMMLNEPLAKTARAPLMDLYDCSEHCFTQLGVETILASLQT